MASGLIWESFDCDVTDTRQSHSLDIRLLLADTISGNVKLWGSFNWLQLRQTEYWNEESLVNFASSYQEPALYRYYQYPEMFLVPRGFCKDGLAPEY